MGGFTTLKLKDCSEENIKKHNELLRKHKVRKSISFYSESDIELEYLVFKDGKGHFPNHLFPADKIKTYRDFKKYWNPKALGEVFCPNNGTLVFDCYFGRTSDNAMRCLKNYIIDALLLSEYFLNTPFEYASGSWSTYLERCSASKLGLELIREKIKEK